MIVVFDSNIWLSQLGLRNAAASGVRFFLRQNNHKVALPEVVQMEVEIHLRQDILGHMAKIKDSHEKILTLFGKLPEVVLPSEDQVDSLIAELFASLGVDLMRLPFTLESARQSLLKTIWKVPPSNNQQQFKDGVIWSDCLQLLENDDVTLVTADTAFFAGHKYANGLAANLQAEANGHLHNLRVLSGISEFLEEIKTRVEFDEFELANLLLKSAESCIDGLYAAGFVLGDKPDVSRKLFATENPDQLFFDYSVTLLCPNINATPRKSAVLTIEAEGLYICSTKEFESINMKSSGFTFFDENNEEVKRRDVWVRANAMTSGHRESRSVIRHQL